MFVRTTLVALVLASPAWADPDYPAGLFERSPLNDTPPAASRQGLSSPGQAKNPPRERARAAATTIASGVIHGRNHAERIVHPQTLGEAADCPIAKCRGHRLVQSPLLSRRTMRAWSSDMKDRTADVCLCNALCAEVCSIFVLASRERQAIKVGPNTREGRRRGAKADKAGL
jgi:hypothetical protein